MSISIKQETEICHKFAFFWVGENISIPECLVKSIMHIYKKDFYIYQLTDRKTKKINGVSEVVRLELPDEIMLARLHAYKAINDQDMLIYLDADSLIINYVDLPKKNPAPIYLVKRNDNATIINHNYPEFYPEFYKKKFIDVMPLFFGFIATNNGHSFLNDLLILAENLPKRFHRWYGDQIALNEFFKTNPKKFEILNEDQYLFLAKKLLNRNEILNLKNQGTKIVTFKGNLSKNFIEETLKELINEEN